MEVKAGIQFQRIGAPQPSEIIKSAARDAIRYVILLFDHVASMHYCNGHNALHLCMFYAAFYVSDH